MLSYFEVYVKPQTKNRIPERKNQSMKNKVLLIFLIIVLAAAAIIVIKGIADKKERQKQDIIHAESIIAGDTEADDTVNGIYEYYQTNPETGLAVIYTFSVSTDEHGKGSGKITIDNGGKICTISCAVKKENDSTVFLFAEYEDASESMGEFEVGDVLVRLHSREKALVPKWAELKSLYPGEEIVRNY